jgi:hypothetical protein
VLIEEDGLIKYPIRDPVTKLVRNALLVPVDLRGKILHAMHDDPAAGHLGVFATQDRVMNMFWWPGCRAEVETYVRKCHSCHVNKKLGVKKKTGIRPIPFTLTPWWEVHIDYCVLHDPRDDKKKVDCLIMVDRFTKEVELAVTKNQKDKETIQKFSRRILWTKGHVHTVVSDCGHGGEFGKFLNKKHIQHHKASPNRHVGNGLAERNIRSVREYLRHYVSESSSIKDLVAQAQFALNTGVKGTTKYSPFRLNHGREATTEIEIELGHCEDASQEDIRRLNPDTISIPLEAITGMGDNKDTLATGEEIAQEAHTEEAARILAKEEEIKGASSIKDMGKFGDVKVVEKSPLEKQEEDMKLTLEAAGENLIGQQQRLMDSQLGDMKLMGYKFSKGDLVYLDRHLEPRDVAAKSGTQTFGPYQVRGYGYSVDHEKNKQAKCEICDGNFLHHVESPYVVVFNPWAGPSSEFTVHQDDARLWMGELPKKRILAINEELQWSKLTSQATKNAVTRAAKALGITPNKLSYLDLIGQRVWVKWTAKQGAGGTWNGTVIDYEPLKKAHFIRYDVQDVDGHDVFPQNLVNNGAGNNWGLIERRSY